MLRKKIASTAQIKNTSVFKIIACFKNCDPVLWTVFSAIVIPFLVIINSAIQTSDTNQNKFKIESWHAGKQMIHDSGKGIAIFVGIQPTYIFYRIPGYQQNASEFSCVISMKKPLPPKILLYYRQKKRSDENGVFRVMNLSNQIHSTANNTIFIKFDDYAGLINANELALSFASPHGENIITLKNPSLKTFTFTNRFKQITKALFRRQPLTQGSNNFILSQKINGYGYLFYLWVSAIVSLSLLLFRRFIIRNKFSIVVHISITFFVIVLLVDLRNTNDYFLNALAAAKLRFQSNNLAEHLGKHEIRFRWFGDVVSAIQKELPNGGKYFARIEDRQRGTKQAVTRAVYYARPALRTDNVTEAKIAILYNISTEDFEHSPDWQLKTLYPSGVYVYVKNQ